MGYFLENQEWTKVILENFPNSLFTLNSDTGEVIVHLGVDQHCKDCW